MIAVYACTMIIAPACPMFIVHTSIVHASPIVVVHACTMIIVHVSCPTRLMFREIKDGSLEGDGLQESREVWGAASPTKLCPDRAS